MIAMNSKLSFGHVHIIYYYYYMTASKMQRSGANRHPFVNYFNLKNLIMLRHVISHIAPLKCQSLLESQRKLAPTRTNSINQGDIYVYIHIQDINLFILLTLTFLAQCCMGQ